MNRTFWKEATFRKQWMKNADFESWCFLLTYWPNLKDPWNFLYQTGFCQHLISSWNVLYYLFRFQSMNFAKISHMYVNFDLKNNFRLKQCSNASRKKKYAKCYVAVKCKKFLHCTSFLDFFSLSSPEIFKKWSETLLTT